VSTTAVRFGRVSLRVNPRSIAVCLLLIAATLAVGVWSIMVGDFPLTAQQVFDAVFGTGDDDAEFIVQTLRLPRTLTAMLVGAALGMSGAVFQSIARNPLGSPDIIGFESGAAVGAVFVITILNGTSGQVALGALAGGMGTALLVYLLAWRGGLAASRLVLVGIGLGFTATAAVDYMITRAQIYDVQRVAVWLTGSLNGRGWDHVRTVGLALAALAPLIVLATVRVAAAITVEAALSFLGFGDPSAATWGNIVATGRPYLTNAPWIATLGGLAISVTVLGLNLVGDGLRDAMDPRLKGGVSQ